MRIDSQCRIICLPRPAFEKKQIFEIEIRREKLIKSKVGGHSFILSTFFKTNKLAAN